MEPEIDFAAGIAGVLILVVIGVSLALWIRHFQKRGTRSPPPLPDTGAAQWPIGWINFGIFVSTMIATVGLVQYFGGHFLLGPAPESGEERALTPELAVAAVLLLQLPMLAVFYGLRRFYPQDFGGALNTVDLSATRAFWQCVPLFFMLLPIIWISGLVWNLLLIGLESVDLIEKPQPQELVKLFAEGGDPVTIGILVVFAVVLAPVVEELIFRANIYRFLKSQTNLWMAQILSGCLFALIHANLLSLGPLIVVGILLAHVYEKSGNILVPIYFHAFFNAFSLIMLLIISQSAAEF